MGGCRNYGPFLGTLNIRCRIIIGIQKGTIILTTTHIGVRYTGYDGVYLGLMEKQMATTIYGLGLRVYGRGFRV